MLHHLLNYKRKSLSNCLSERPFLYNISLKVSVQYQHQLEYNVKTQHFKIWSYQCVFAALKSCPIWWLTFPLSRQLKMTKNTCYLTTRWLISGFIHKYPLLATNTKVNSCFIIHSNSKIIKHIKMILTYYSFKTIYSCNTIKCSCPNPMHLKPRWTAHDIWNLNSKSDCTFKAIHCFSIY